MFCRRVLAFVTLRATVQVDLLLKVKQTPVLKSINCNYYYPSSYILVESYHTRCISLCISQANGQAQEITRGATSRALDLSQ